MRRITTLNVSFCRENHSVKPRWQHHASENNKQHGIDVVAREKWKKRSLFHRNRVVQQSRLSYRRFMQILLHIKWFIFERTKWKKWQKHVNEHLTAVSVFTKSLELDFFSMAVCSKVCLRRSWEVCCILFVSLWISFCDFRHGDILVGNSQHESLMGVFLKVYSWLDWLDRNTVCLSWSWVEV